MYYHVLHYKDVFANHNYVRLGDKSYKTIGTARTAAKNKLNKDYVSSSLFKIDIVKRQEGFKVTHSVSPVK